MRRPRNTLVERHQKAAQRIAMGASDVPPDPIMDNVAHLRTAHDVRRLCICCHCKGPGDRVHMISVQKPYHTLCFRQTFGFAAVLALPDTQQGKFRISDLSIAEMRKLLNHRKQRA